MKKSTPKSWVIAWDYSPSGSTSYVHHLPLPGEDIWAISVRNEGNALVFDDERVAWGAAVVLSNLFESRFLPYQRWNGLPPATQGQRFDYHFTQKGR